MFENSNLNKPQKRLWICIYLFLLWGLYNLKMSFVGNGAVKDVAHLAKLIRNTT